MEGVFRGWEDRLVGLRGVVGLENIGIEGSFMSPIVDVKSCGDKGSRLLVVAMTGSRGDNDVGDVLGDAVLHVEGETYECLIPGLCLFSVCSCASAYFRASSWCTAREKRRQKSGSRTVPIVRLCCLQVYAVERQLLGGVWWDERRVRGVKEYIEGRLLGAIQVS
jgi:hypothetical protein